MEGFQIDPGQMALSGNEETTQSAAANLSATLKYQFETPFKKIEHVDASIPTIRIQSKSMTFGQKIL